MWVDFVFIYKSKRRKPVEIVLRKVREEQGEDEGMNLTKIHCKHICKHNSVFPCTAITC
jgi:hypothetical protein